MVLMLVSRRRDATKAMTTASLLGAIGVCVSVVPLESGGRMEPALDWMEVSRELWREAGSASSSCAVNWRRRKLGRVKLNSQME